MIKYFLVCLMMLFIQSGISQYSFKYSVGLNYSNYDVRMVSPNFKKNYQEYWKYRFLFNTGIEFEYKLPKYLNFFTGAILSYRGSKEYLTPPPFREYNLSNYVFLEIPFVMLYRDLIQYFDIGGGVNLNKRLGSNTIRYGEYEKPYGCDLKVILRYLFWKRFHLVTSYTFGNYDKMLFGHQDVYLHHVFALNIQYTFWRF